jgi:hypothetical protein
MLLQMLAKGGFVSQYGIATAREIGAAGRVSAGEKRISPLRFSR